VELEFQEKYLIMLDKEYRIRSVADEEAVYKKRKRIYKKTGKNPRVVASFRNPV
jgi:hypothetical protein